MYEKFKVIYYTISTRKGDMYNIKTDKKIDKRIIAAIVAAVIKHTKG